MLIKINILRGHGIRANLGIQETQYLLQEGWPHPASMQSSPIPWIPFDQLVEILDCTDHTNIASMLLADDAIFAATKEIYFIQGTFLLDTCILQYEH